MKFLSASKNLITLLALACAVWSIFGAQPQNVGWLFLLAWMLDALDGLVARLTHSSDEFGARLDNLVDLFIYTIAPSFLINTHYHSLYPTLGFILAYAMITCGVLRLVRYDAQRLYVPGYWMGLPRPAVGFLVVSLLEINMRKPHFSIQMIFLLLTTAFVLSLTYLRYPNHHLDLSTTGRISLALILVFLAAIFLISNLWWTTLVATLIYICLPLLMLTPIWSSVLKQQSKSMANAGL